MTVISAIVGARFHPPAQLLLEILPQGTPLILEPEPDNPYDSSAIKVSILPKDLAPHLKDLTTEMLINFGYTVERLQGICEPLHLGYLPKSDKTAGGTSINSEVLAVIGTCADWECTLTSDLTGRPAIKLSY